MMYVLLCTMFFSDTVGCFYRPCEVIGRKPAKTRSCVLQQQFCPQRHDAPKHTKSTTLAATLKECTWRSFEYFLPFRKKWVLFSINQGFHVLDSSHSPYCSAPTKVGKHVLIYILLSATAYPLSVDCKPAKLRLDHITTPSLPSSNSFCIQLCIVREQSQ